MGLSIERPVETHLVNVVGTLNVLMAARAAGVRRVVYSGSSSVYGEQSGAQPPLPLRETMTPNPMSPYALQKLMGEEYVRIFHRLYGLGAISLATSACTARGWIWRARMRLSLVLFCARGAKGGRSRFAATASSGVISRTCATTCARTWPRWTVRSGTVARSTSGAAMHLA